MIISLILLWLTALFAGFGIGRASFGVSHSNHKIILQGIWLIIAALLIQGLSVLLNLQTLEVLNHA